MGKVEKAFQDFFARVLPGAMMGETACRETGSGRIEIKIVLSFPSWDAVKRGITGTSSY